MKKLLFFIATAILSANAAFAQSNAKTNRSELHPDIHTFLNQHFPNDAVKNYKLEWNGPEISYFDLVLNSGTEVVFNRDGKWIDVEMAMKAELPKGVAPEVIDVYVKTAHKGAYITDIEKEHTGYEVKLSNGLELNFTQSGEYLGMNK